MFKEDGFPDNLFRSLLISGKQVKEVVENPLVKAETLTGSENTGNQSGGRGPVGGGLLILLGLGGAYGGYKGYQNYQKKKKRLLD